MKGFSLLILIQCQNVEQAAPSTLLWQAIWGLHEFILSLVHSFWKTTTKELTFSHLRGHFKTYGFSLIHEGLICDSLITFGGESMKEFTKGEEKMNKIAGQELALVPWIQMSRGVFWTIFVSDLRKSLSGALLCTSTWQFHEWPIELGVSKWTFCICVFYLCVFVCVFSSSSIC